MLYIYILCIFFLHVYIYQYTGIEGCSAGCGGSQYLPRGAGKVALVVQQAAVPVPMVIGYIFPSSHWIRFNDQMVGAAPHSSISGVSPRVRHGESLSIVVGGEL